MNIDILKENLKEAQRLLNKLTKKAEKYNIPFTYRYGEEFMKTFVIQDENGINRKVPFLVIPFEIDDIVIKNEGWKVIALIKHDETCGSIITQCNDVPIESEMYTLKPKCEHCGTDRLRKKTFLVKNIVTNEIRQVGVGCLKEYTGIDSRSAMYGYSIIKELTRGMEGLCELFANGNKVLETVDTVAKAIMCIDKYGYVGSSDDHDIKTKERVLSFNNSAVSEEAIIKAKEMIECVSELEAYTDYQHNLVSIAKHDVFLTKYIGLAVCIPLEYAKIKRKKERDEENKKIIMSNHVGEVGKRVEIIVDRIKMIATYDTEYGTTRIYKMFVAGTDNIIIWKASGLGLPETDGTVIVKATIKEHSMYDGVKQTVVQRCKRVG